MCAKWNDFALLFTLFFSRRVTVQLHPSDLHGSTVHGLQGLKLFSGIDHVRFASSTWQDFLAVAPWITVYSCARLGDLLIYHLP